MTQPNGAFYLFCKLPTAIQTDSWQFCREVAEQAKVACIPGIAFGPEGEGYIRISYASSMEKVHEGLQTDQKDFLTRTVIHRFYQKTIVNFAVYSARRRLFLSSSNERVSFDS